MRFLQTLAGTLALAVLAVAVIGSLFLLASVIRDWRES